MGKRALAALSKPHPAGLLRFNKNKCYRSEISGGQDGGHTPKSTTDIIYNILIYIQKLILIHKQIQNIE